MKQKDTNPNNMRRHRKQKSIESSKNQTAKQTLTTQENDGHWKQQ